MKYCSICEDRSGVLDGNNPYDCNEDGCLLDAPSSVLVARPIEHHEIGELIMEKNRANRS